MASIGAIALWPYRMGACSHKQVINIFCMILAFSVIIYEVLKILLEKWPKLFLIEAILGYLILPHKQRLKAVQVNFICYFAVFEWNFVVPQGGVSQGSRVGRDGGRGVVPFVILKTSWGNVLANFMSSNMMTMTNFTWC